MHLIPLRGVLQLSFVIIWQKGDDTDAREWLKALVQIRTQLTFACAYTFAAPWSQRVKTLSLAHTNKILDAAMRSIWANTYDYAFIRLKTENTQGSWRERMISQHHISTWNYSVDQISLREFFPNSPFHSFPRHHRSWKASCIILKPSAVCGLKISLAKSPCEEVDGPWMIAIFFLIKHRLPRSSSNFGTVIVKDDMVCVHGETSEDAIRSSFRKRMYLNSVVWCCCDQSSILKNKNKKTLVSETLFMPKENEMPWCSQWLGRLTLVAPKDIKSSREII